MLNEDGSVLEMVDDSNILVEEAAEQDQTPEEDSFVEPDVPEIT